MKHRTHYLKYLPYAILTIAITIFAAGLTTPSRVFADNETSITCKDGTSVPIQVGGDAEAACKDHGGYTTACKDGTKQPGSDAAAACKSHGGVADAATPPATNTPAEDPALTCNILPQAICDSAKSGGSDAKSSGIFALLKWILNILTAVVGVAAVGTLVYAGIMYSSAGDDSGMVSKAKTIIRDTIIGIVAYGLMVVLLNFIVPGGVFG